VDADTLALENLNRWWYFYRKGLITRRELFQAVLVAGGAAGAGLLSGMSPGSWPGAAGVAPVSAAAAKETVTLHLNSDVPNLDPHMHILREEIIIMYHMYNNLGTRDLKTMKIGPDLATAWKIVSPTVWEMDLRQGVRFHNGEPFTADTVKFNYDRVLNPAQKSPQRGNHEAVDHVEVLGPYKVRIVTKRPYPIFVERLQNFQMQPEKYVKDKGDAYVAEHPVGTGPYKFVDWKRGSEVNVVRNDDYWGPKAAIPRAKFRIITDVATAVAELLAGNVDIVRYVPTDQIATINRSGRATAKVQKILRVEYVALDAAGRFGTNPFQDKRVRQAANYAIDADLYLKRLQPGGDKTPAALNPMHFGFDPSISPYSHNPDMARKLLAEAGYKNGFDARWLTSNLGMPSYQNVYDAMTQDLAGVGIRAKQQFIQATQTLVDLITSGKAGPMFGFSWGSYSVFDADGLYWDCFHPTSNLSYWRHPRFAQLIEAARGTIDPDLRRRFYASAQRIVHEEAPVIFLWGFHSVFGASNAIDWSPEPDEIVRLYNVKPHQA
jgi:peptide/nickel transport system substrate-binding protein